MMQNAAEGPQLAKSDVLLLFIGNEIPADQDKWGIMLTSKHGKKEVKQKFIDFLRKHASPITSGKSTSSDSSPETLFKRIRSGLEAGALESKRRTDRENSGRCAANGSVQSFTLYILILKISGKTRD